MFSLPAKRSAGGSKGEGSKFGQDVRDWLESSLDTIKRNTNNH